MSQDRTLAWKGKAFLAGIVGTLLVSGALAAFFVRPSGRYWRGDLRQLGFDLALVRGVSLAHQIAAWTVVAIVAFAFARGFQRSGRLGSLKTLWTLVLVAFLASAFLVPWHRLRPWSPSVGANMAKATVLYGHEGPFPQLVGVNVTYDDAERVLGGLRFGPTAVKRFYYLHVVGLPLVAAVVAVGTWRRYRRRQPAG